MTPPCPNPTDVTRPRDMTESAPAFASRDRPTSSGTSFATPMDGWGGSYGLSHDDGIDWGI